MTELSEVTAETVGLSWLINDISRTTCFGGPSTKYLNKYFAYKATDLRSLCE